MFRGFVVQAVEFVDVVVSPFVRAVEVVEGEEGAGVKVCYVVFLYDSNVLDQDIQFLHQCLSEIVGEPTNHVASCPVCSFWDKRLLGMRMFAVGLYMA